MMNNHLLFDTSSLINLSKPYLLSQSRTFSSEISSRGKMSMWSIYFFSLNSSISCFKGLSFSSFYINLWRISLALAVLSWDWNYFALRYTYCWSHLSIKMATVAFGKEFYTMSMIYQFYSLTAYTIGQIMLIKFYLQATFDLKTALRSKLKMEG